MGIPVKALAKGVYGRVYAPGETFVIAHERHLGSWMVPTRPEDAKRLAPQLSRLAQAHRPQPDYSKVPPTTGPSKSFPQPLGPKAPDARAELQKVKGIGPELADLLLARGIRDLEQLSAQAGDAAARAELVGLPGITEERLLEWTGVPAVPPKGDEGGGKKG